MIAALVAVLVVLLLLGFPIMMPLIAATFVAFYFFLTDLPPEIVIQQMVGGVEPVALIAVPLFIFAADIITKGAAANRLLDLVMRFVGHLRGGLAISTAASCTLFGAVSGSTQATVVAIGGPLRPRLLKAGYPDSFALALIINSSDIALLIPPSIGLIIYGVVSGTSVAELFIAGIAPGILLLALFSAYAYAASWFYGVPRERRASWALRRKAIVRALFPLGFPVIVIGGIYAGYFSPTEAAAMSVFYAFILEVLIFREVKLRDIPQIALSTGLITAVVFILVAAGNAFSWTLSFAHIPQQILGGLDLSHAGQLRLLLTIAVAFFIGCMFVDPIVVILILTPIFAPYVAAVGVDPVLVGVIVTLQAAIGSATPPFGVDIFTAIAIFKRPYLDIIRGTPPFIAILLVASAILILFPEISLFLRDLAFPPMPTP